TYNYSDSDWNFLIKYEYPSDTKRICRMSGKMLKGSLLIETYRTSKMIMREKFEGFDENGECYLVVNSEYDNKNRLLKESRLYPKSENNQYTFYSYLSKDRYKSITYSSDKKLLSYCFFDGNPSLVFKQTTYDASGKIVATMENEYNSNNFLIKRILSYPDANERILTEKEYLNDGTVKEVIYENGIIVSKSITTFIDK
ncbi:MAG: hypothetical protein JXR63_06460, partial [Spirochaetales bacterium]|nr:hypothetical protein [Spirochaetales bacterium]